MEHQISSPETFSNSTHIEQSSVDIVLGSIVVITHNLGLLCLSFLNLLLSYAAVLVKYILQYLPPVIQGVHLSCVIAAGYLLTVTTYCDDLIMTLCNALSHVINLALDGAESVTVTLHDVLPQYAALPLQVLMILWGWGKTLGSTLLCFITWRVPGDSETLDTLTELYTALCDLGGVVGVITVSVLSQSTELIFSTLLSLITSAKYITLLLLEYYRYPAARSCLQCWTHVFRPST